MRAAVGARQPRWVETMLRDHHKLVDPLVTRRNAVLFAAERRSRAATEEASGADRGWIRVTASVLARRLGVGLTVVDVSVAAPCAREMSGPGARLHRDAVADLAEGDIRVEDAMSPDVYARALAAAKSRLVARAGAAQALVATAWPALAIAVAVTQRWLSINEAAAMLAGTAAVTLICAQRFHARAGGITGDFLGATQQVCECAALLALALMRGDGP